jgi:hypothetical protein
MTELLLNAWVIPTAICVSVKLPDGVKAAAVSVDAVRQKWPHDQ